MKRRILLKGLAAGLLAGGAGQWWWRARSIPAVPSAPPLVVAPPLEQHDPEPGPAGHRPAGRQRRFDADHPGDRWLAAGQRPLLSACVDRLARLQSHIGHGRFSMLGFDAMLAYAASYPVIGAFTAAEKDFLEDIFSRDARDYGFLGDKVMARLTDTVPGKAVVKIPRSGNYLYRGEALAMYRRLRRDIGEDMVLTSGIRGMAKQMYLFLAKTRQVGGNLSRASRQLAPPGHSYHGIGDFDVGQVGLGRDNFTERFARSEAFHKLVDLGYVDIRYTDGNAFGVRYEPWHIKVV